MSAPALRSLLTNLEEYRLLYEATPPEHADTSSNSVSEWSAVDDE
jgi:hypothetical protein